MRVLVSTFVAIGLTACANDPSVTVSKGTKEAPGSVVSVCYNASNTTRELVAALARDNCPTAGSGLRVWDHDSLLNSCPISKRNRVTFLCIPPG